MWPHVPTNDVVSYTAPLWLKNRKTKLRERRLATTIKINLFRIQFNVMIMILGRTSNDKTHVCIGTVSPKRYSSQ